MKKYKIDLRGYAVRKITPVVKEGKIVGQKAEKGKEDYDIRRVIKLVLLSPGQAHKGFRFYSFTKIAAKVKKAEGDFVVLSGEEYNMVKSCFDNFSGFGLDDEEMVRRIYEAEEINGGLVTDVLEETNRKEDARSTDVAGKILPKEGEK